MAYAHKLHLDRTGRLKFTKVAASAQHRRKAYTRGNKEDVASLFSYLNLRVDT